MANAMDYLDWRGDLPFTVSPFNEVDNLLLSELSYMNFTGIVPDIGGGRSVPLPKAIDAFFAQNSEEELSMGVLLPRGILDMAKKMAKTERFSRVRLCCCRSLWDTDQEAQFAAITAKLGDRSIYLAFRGTDDTIVGWKEDFNMTFLPKVPSQEYALAYVKEVAARYRGAALRLGGHSKGGNLAVYGGVYCGSSIQRRIKNIYSNDGPGFKESILEEEAYQAVRDKIVTIVPQSSVVGFLLEHDDNFSVVKSTNQGLYQHDGLSWEVCGTSFVPTQRSADGHANQARIRAFFNRLNDEQREQFAKALYDVLSSNNAQTLTELDADWGKTFSGMVRTYRSLDKDSRQMLLEAAKIMLQTGTETIKEGIGEKSSSFLKWLEAVLPVSPTDKTDKS